MIMNFLTSGPCPMTMATLDHLLLVCILYSLTDLGVGQTDAAKKTTACNEKYKALEAFGSQHHVMCLADDSGATGITLTAVEEKIILDTHNNFRSRVTPAARNMQMLVYDQKIAVLAAKSARLCRDVDANINVPDYRKTDMGQNEAYGFDLKGALDRWLTKGAVTYTFGGTYTIDNLQHFQAITATANRIGCGSAMCPWVRANASRVGCGMPTCPNQGLKLRHFVCIYSYKLNINFPPYWRGTSCSWCPKSCGSGKLCDCKGKLCFNHGFLGVRTCSCLCQKGWKGEQCEIRDCGTEVLDRCYRLMPEHCRNKRIIRDPDYCPILCGLCPKIEEGESCAGRAHNCIPEAPFCSKPAHAETASQCVCTQDSKMKGRIMCLDGLKEGEYCGSDVGGCVSEAPLCMRHISSYSSFDCSCTKQSSREGKVVCDPGFDMPLLEGEFCAQRPQNCRGRSAQCLRPASAGQNISACACTSVLEERNRRNYVDCLSLGAMSGGSLVLPLWSRISLSFIILLISVVLGRVIC